VIVIFSAREALYIMPLDWQRNLILEGSFTVESDREVVAKLGEMALSSKIAHLRGKGPLPDYRFYLAQQPRLLNRPKENFSLPTFCEHFGFKSLTAAKDTEKPGMTGLLCATIAGDAEILETLVRSKADVNARICGLGHLGYSDSLTLLMVAAYSCQETKILSALISLRADPNQVCVSESGSVITASWLASHPSHVRVFMEGEADFLTSPPLIGVAGSADTETVQAFLEVRCDPCSVSQTGFGPLFSCCLFGRGNPHATGIMQLLLNARGDANAKAQPRGQLYWECLRARASASFWGLERCGVYQRQMASLPGATPLSIAALMGDRALVQLLLDNNAEPGVNDRGDTPEDLARAAGHTELLELLSFSSSTFFA